MQNGRIRLVGTLKPITQRDTKHEAIWPPIAEYLRLAIALAAVVSRLQIILICAGAAGRDPLTGML